MRLDHVDHRADPAAWAKQLSVSPEAATVLLGSDFIDLHLDLEVPVRLLGYDARRRHSVRGGLPIPFFGHTDWPRLREGGLTGVVYDIATNPIRSGPNRVAATLANLQSVQDRVAPYEDCAIVRTHGEYVQAKADGKLAFWLALQGGNALSHDPSVLDGPTGDLLHRITLVHLTTSDLGGTSSPLGGDIGITAAGRAFVERCNARRVLVDLAHAGKKTFWGALEAHSKDVPPIVSHTGVAAVRQHWRNLDDDQIRAIADRGGVIGIMYQSSFLERTLLWGRRASIVDHLEHVIGLVGEDFAAIGTDYDGMIIPPSDLPDVTSHPLLVQDMLDRGWSVQRIQKVLGENYLRVVRVVRP